MHKGETMTGRETEIETKKFNQHVFALFQEVIQKSNNCSAKDAVSHALLCFLVRVANTWQSIRTLQEYSPDDKGFMVDAAVLLRAMLDACLQAEYMFHDANKDARASDYLEYEHVEQYKIREKVHKHDNWLTRRLKSSTKWPEGEKRALEEYNRVKGRYLVQKQKGKKQSGGTQKRGPRTRNKWYTGDLSTIAESLGKRAEYDTFVTVFNGCVHSSALAVLEGPPIQAQHVLTFASKIAARVARLNVQHNRIDVVDPHGPIMNKLCEDFFENNPEK